MMKNMAKKSNIRQTEEWKESKMQMISILTRKMRNVKVDNHFMNVVVNDTHMETPSWVSGVGTLSFSQNISPYKYNELCYL